MKIHRLHLVLSSLLVLASARGELRESLRTSREALAAGDLPAATAAAEDALRADPGSPEAWKQYVRALHLAGEAPRALTASATALSLDPNDTELRHWRISLLLETLRGHALLSAFRDLPPTDASLLDPDDLAEWALRLWEDNRIDDARTFLRWHADNAPEADSSLWRWVETGHGTPSPRFSGAAAYLQALRSTRDGDPAKALDALDAAEKLLPGRLSISRERGWALYRLGRYGEAVEAWASGGEAAAARRGLWIARARAAQGLREEALNAVEEFLAGGSSHPEALFLKGSLLLSLRGPLAAEAFWRELPDATLRAGVESVARARQEAELGHPARAAELLEPWLAESSVPEFLQAEVDRLLAEWLAATPPDQQWRVLDRAVRWQPGRPELLRDLGWSLWRADKREEAVDRLGQALDAGLEPAQPLLLQVVARLVEEERIDDAIAFFRSHGGGEKPLGLFARELVRRNRVLAARPLLELALAQGDPDPLVGLYLAYARALAGDCRDPHLLLSPWLATLAQETDPVEVDMALEVFHRCGQDDALVEILRQHPGLADPARPQAPRVTDILADAALEWASVGRDAEALPLFLRVLERDPSRPLWAAASECARRLGDTSRAVALLRDAPLEKLPPWQAHRVRGLRSLARDNPAAAAEAFGLSLDADPTQLDLIPTLFSLLLDLGQDDEAASQMERLRRRVDEGDTSHAPRVADMLDQLGRPSDAAFYWDLARIQSPEIPYYALSTARALADSCQAEAALALLRRRFRASPDPATAIFTVELALSLARLEEAAEFADQALAHHPRDVALLRLRAEIAEQAGEFPDAATLAARALALRPDSASLRALEARTLLATGDREAAAARYFSMLADGVLPATAHARLREILVLDGDPSRATDHARALLSLRPADPEAKVLLAASLAELPDYPAAVEILEPLASRPVSDAVPVLLYSRVGSCGLPGLHSLQSVRTHLEVLEEAQIAPILVFDQPRPHIMAALTELLREHNLHAYLLRGPRIPGGPEALGIWTRLEAVEEAENAFRVAGLPESTLRAWRVPVDTSPEHVVEHATRDNPFASARLSLAKVLSWQNQNTRADPWFLSAREAGADPGEVALQRGLNALRAEDHTLALSELNLARELRPDDPRADAALAVLRERRNPAVNAEWEWTGDSDHRDFTRFGVEALAFPSTALQLAASLSSLELERKGWGTEQGRRVSLGGLGFVRDLTSLEATVSYTEFEDAADFTGWSARLHLPLSAGESLLDFSAARDIEPTVEAVQQNIRAERYRTEGFARLDERWDLRLHAEGCFRTDDNDGREIGLLLLRRLSEIPFAGLGIRARLADSDRDSPLYYSPVELQKYQLHFALRGRGSPAWSYSTSIEAGYAHEEEEDWKFVWGGRAELGWSLLPHLELGLRASHMESPSYRMDSAFLTLGIH